MANIQHGPKRPRFPNKWLFIGSAVINLGVFWIGFYVGSVMV